MPNSFPAVRPVPPTGVPASDAQFVRSFVPVKATWPKSPTGYRARSESGRMQTRLVAEYGKTWTETYGLMENSVFSAAVRESGGGVWIEYIDQLYRRSIPVLITPPHATAPLRCIVADYVSPEAGVDEFYVGLKITFLEIAPSV